MSAGTVPRWTVLALLLPIMLYWVDWRQVPNKVLLVLIALYAAASTLWAEVKPDSYLELFRLTLLIAAFTIGAVSGSLERLLRVMAIGVAVTFPLVLLQVVGYVGVPQTAPPAGLFLNQNVLAESAAVLLIAMAYTRQWFLAALLLAIVIMAREKASFVGLAIATIVYLFYRMRMTAYALMFACAVFTGMMISTGSAIDRLDIWQDTLRGVTFFGNGIGSFYAVFPAEAVHTNVIEVRPEQAHNEYLHALFELGVPGLALCLALACQALRGSLELERLMLVFILAVSIFAFPLHMPFTAFVAALVAGRLCSSQRDAGRRATHDGSRHA